MNGGSPSGAAARNASFIAFTRSRLATLVLRYITPPISLAAISSRSRTTDASSTLSPWKPTTIICPAICSRVWAERAAVKTERQGRR